MASRFVIQRLRQSWCGFKLISKPGLQPGPQARTSVVVRTFSIIYLFFSAKKKNKQIINLKTNIKLIMIITYYY